MNVFDVRIHSIRRPKTRPRRPFEVRWHAAGRARSPSFATRDWRTVTALSWSALPARAACGSWTCALALAGVHRYRWDPWLPDVVAIATMSSHTAG